ncbi:MAG TPA: mandelate racemase/muconate lactonizing enzyme family protein [Verrucomicrobiae bacterium]|nr:mandelate racemase/muconate lactonizing enzyme family protein [Verrucomicrobiae bacterium]
MASRSFRISRLRLYSIPIRTRIPLKFGSETLTSVECFRVGLSLVDEQNNSAEGWGETPLSVQWVWPSPAPYQQRLETLQKFCRDTAQRWISSRLEGHPLESGYDFIENSLRQVFDRFNKETRHGQHAPRAEPMPWLAALVSNSAFDLALHDAYGRLLGKPIYETYRPEYLGGDLAGFMEPAPDTGVSFRNRYPSDYLVKSPAKTLLAWHLVGGLDPIHPGELTGGEPADGHPVLLEDWIKRDGLKCLKIKLRGTDEKWDYQRLTQVGELALPLGVEWLTADFNCTVVEPGYVNEILDRLQREHREIFDRLLYVEQPFAYDLERDRLDVHSVSSRKPLFLDESAHDWRMIRLGRDLGWTGVALKTCKTQTGAILSACWARAHGIQLMVQDLTNPMLAQVPHVLLASHVGTIMGVETNSMQFYPEASLPEANVHPGIYQRREGAIDLSSITGPGFGYRVEEIRRVLPPPLEVLRD